MTLEQVVQYTLSGVTIGSIYAIVAIGYNIIYNTTGIINFAQGEFVMLGGMTAISFNQFMPLPLAILCSVIVVAAAGALLDFTIIRTLKAAYSTQYDYCDNRTFYSYTGDCTPYMG
jgi:branched-chain amino acid transport system permease protein